MLFGRHGKLLLGFHLLQIYPARFGIVKMSRSMKMRNNWSHIAEVDPPISCAFGSNKVLYEGNMSDTFMHFLTVFLSVIHWNSSQVCTLVHQSSRETCVKIHKQEMPKIVACLLNGCKHNHRLLDMKQIAWCP